VFVGRFRFQLTGDAGAAYAIQTSTNLLDSNSWTLVTNLPNPFGTVWFTNSTPAVEWPLFFRAQRLP
jgi:hypothetical protein